MDTDQNYPDVSRSTPDEKDNGIGPKHTTVERVLRLLLLLLVNECTRLEIFERLAPYYKVDDNFTGRDSSSRRADRMFERDLKLLEEQGFEIQKIKAKGRFVRRRQCCFISGNWSPPSVLECLSFLSWSSKRRI